MAKLKNVIEHLKIIRTWAEVDGESGRGMESKCCLRVAEWVDEALETLQEERSRLLASESECEKLRSKHYTDWSGAQGNEGERIKAEAERGKWGIFG